MIVISNAAPSILQKSDVWIVKFPKPYKIFVCVIGGIKQVENGYELILAPKREVKND